MKGQGESLGCDVGGTTIQLIQLRRGRISARKEIPSRRDASPSEFLDMLCTPMRELVRNSKPFCPVGIALPGFLDDRRRKINHLSNLPRLAGLPLAARLERRLGTTVILEADSNAGAVGESRLGAGRSADRVLYVTLGTGLGAAVCIRGQPVRVSHQTVGQVAHVPLRSGGPTCACGRRGCAEALLSARGILGRAGRRYGREAVRRLGQDADRGDAQAIGAWRETGEILGDLLCILTPLFGIEIVVIGGGIAAASSHFLPATRQRIGRPRRRSGAPGIEVTVARFGPFAGAVGAALLARDHVAARD